MKIITAIIMAIITLFTSFFGATPEIEKPLVEETTTETVTEQGYQCEDFVLELFDMVNDYRVENGLNALTLNDEICGLAYIRAQEQEEIKGHTRPDGTKFSTVFNGYGDKWDKCGENIVISSANNAERMFNNWKNSKTHNENMLDEKWDESGIAVYLTEEGRYCFVQLFVSKV